MDLMSNVKVVPVIAPASPAATGTISGLVIDTSGFNSHTFVLTSGLQTTTGITVVPIVTSGSTTDALTPEIDDNLIGTEAEANLSGAVGASKATKIGYIGSNRYVTCDLAVAAGATGLYGVSCIQGTPIRGPQSQS